MFERSCFTVEQIAPKIYAAIQKGNQRQEDHIELIALENYTFPAVMAIQGSQLTNKYAEGYPRKRYYGGCEYVDTAEQLAISRVKFYLVPRLPTFNPTLVRRPIKAYSLPH